MPRISAPSQDAILAKPRAYAYWQLLSPDANGSVSSEAFQELVKKHGEAKSKGDDISFEDFAAMFQPPATKAESGGEGDCIGYAAFDTSGKLSPWRFPRRANGPNDVRIQIAYTGVCHSDIHQIRNEWKGTKYPIVPGHEIAGIVTEVGPKVTKFKVGDRVGVGCMVNSCRECEQCKQHLEQHCPAQTQTYNSTDKDGTITRGGYSTHVVVDQDFVLSIPDKLNFADAAPLLCAGITTYSPIKRFGFDKPGMHVGVSGLGGLGHMAVRFLKAFGVTVTVISHSPHKKDEAMKVLGADHFLSSKDEEAMKAAAGTLDGIIDTVHATHPLEPLVNLMKFKGVHVALGVPEKPNTIPTANLIFRQQVLAGSLIGSIHETQEMLEFCAEKSVYCMVEHIKIDQINTAIERVLKADVRYRFVIDVLDSLVA